MFAIRLLLAVVLLLGVVAPVPAQSLVFMENHGQWEGPVRYAAHDGPLTVLLAQDAVVLRLAGAATGEAIGAATGQRAGAATGVADASLGMTDPTSFHQVVLHLEEAGSTGPMGEAPSPARVRHYRGADASRWVEDGAAFRRVRYAGAWDGIDLVLLERDGRLAWDLHVAPGVDVERAIFRCAGARGLEARPDGSLALHTDAGTLLQSSPVAWQETSDGGTEPVSARLVPLDDGRFGVRVTGRDPDRALVVDPGLVYGSYLGGALIDRAEAVALAPDGDVVLVGSTASADFPVTLGGAIDGLRDAFVARIDGESGALVFATYLGGTDTQVLLPEQARGVALADDGDILLTGNAPAGDFPTTTGALQETSAGAIDAFVVRLDGLGALEWSTYLGGLRDDFAEAVDVDAAGRPTVAGRTFSDDFPVTPGAADTTFNAISIFDEAFVARLSADGTALDYATYLGGQLRDEADDVVVDDVGVATVTGLTGSTDFPVTAGAFDESFNGSSGSDTDAFVARLASDGTAVTWGTFLGGADIVEGKAVALLPAGDVLAGGITETGDLPGTSGAAQASFGGGKRDGYVARLSSDGATLLWATYLGGSGEDGVEALAVNPAGQGTATGFTTSGDFPLTGDAYDATLGGAEDAFLVRLSDGGDGLVYATLYGGSDDEQGTDLALDAFGAAWVVGETASADLDTTPDAADAGANGAGDAFLARLECLPWIDLGHSLPGFGGQTPRLVGTGTLVEGELFSVVLTDARPGSTAYFFLGFSVGALPFKCGTLLVFPFVGAFPFVTFPDGSIPIVAPWPPSVPPGTQVVMQYWISDPDAICNAAGSNGLLAVTP